jgi:hypothetical protein
MRRWPPSSASDCGPWRDAVEASTCAAGRGTRESRSLRVPRSDDHERGNTLISPSPPAQTMSVATGDRLNAGGSPLYFHTTRDATAVGGLALFFLMSGDDNTVIGTRAGQSFGGGSNNIYVGSGVGPPTSIESNTIRIGRNHTSTFIAGIATTEAVGSPVCVATTGQLGRCPPPPPATSNPATGRRHPASFPDTSGPELVMVNAQDESAGGREPGLLHELQRQQREIDELRAQVRALVGGKAVVRE